MHSEPFVIAVAQATPVYIDRAATVAKACGIIREAAARNARLVVFPEAFVPCYPFWIWHTSSSARAAKAAAGEQLAKTASRRIPQMGFQEYLRCLRSPANRAKMATTRALAPWFSLVEQEPRIRTVEAFQPSAGEFRQLLEAPVEERIGTVTKASVLPTLALASVA